MIKAAEKFDETRYQAEQIVRQGIEKSPVYKQAVRETIKELKGLRAQAKIKVAKK